VARTAASDTEDTLGREFAFSDSDFAFIRQMVEQHAAIKLPDSKRQMVYGRLVRRLRELRLGSFAEYVALLRDDPGGPEFVNLINAVTTNLTSFFRERHHFDVLEEKVLPELQQRNASNRRIRVWSAGCSTGEEPYSIAITLRGSSLLSQGWDARILATDIDTKVLATAESGVYGIDRIRDLPEDLKRRGFLRGRGEASQRVRVRPEMQELITFRQLNLMEPWPMRHRFDVIFCRNVVIYFDKPTQARLFDRFADQLNEGGYVFLGHSETMHNLTTRFRLLGQTVYQKVQ
jgi:chemotaxis protein methyltransferase CheR